MASERYRTSEVIGAIEQARGVKVKAAQILGCTRKTVDNYIDRHPTVAEAYHQQRETMVDIAEAELLKHLDSGDLSAIKYVLSRLGYDRGYVERQELTGKDGNELTFRVIYGDDGTDDPPG